MSSPLSVYNDSTSQVTEEHQSHRLPLIYGEIPAELRGVLYRNGPGRLVNHGVPYDHLFDGDGMIMRFEFDNSGVFYTNRYVRTREFVREEAAGKVLYRSFGTNKPGGVPANAFRLHFKNAANTSVRYHGGKSLVLWEGGLPHEIDPVTLETVGRYDFDGALAPGSLFERMMGNGTAFSAHPKRHPRTGDLYNFGLSTGRTQKLLFHHVDASGVARQPAAYTMPELSFIHDFVLTAETDRIFLVVPVAFKLGRTFLGLTTPNGSITGSSERPTLIPVFTADAVSAGDTTVEPAMVLEDDPCYVFHYPNGYRDGERIIVDALRMESFPTSEDVKRVMQGRKATRPLYAYPTRFGLDTASGSVRRLQLSDHPMELPSINPQYRGLPYRFVWGIADRPGGSESGTLHGIGKLDVESGTMAYHDFAPHFTGEPLFVPRPGAQDEDDGWLLSLLFDVEERRTKLVVLDATTLETAGILILPHATRLGFHGTFVQR